MHRPTRSCLLAGLGASSNRDIVRRIVIFMPGTGIIFTHSVLCRRCSRRIVLGNTRMPVLGARGGGGRSPFWRVREETLGKPFRCICVPGMLFVVYTRACMLCTHLHCFLLVATMTAQHTHNRRSFTWAGLYLRWCRPDVGQPRRAR